MARGLGRRGGGHGPQQRPVPPARTALARALPRHGRLRQGVPQLDRGAVAPRDEGGEPFRINPLVDVYNAVSLRHVVPAGGFDLDQLRGPLELRLTRDGDHFIALDADAPIPIPPGEIAYLDGPTVLTRHFVWRQARTGLITPATRSVVLLSEIPGEVGADVARQVLADLAAGLRDHFGAAPSAYTVDAASPSCSW